MLVKNVRVVGSTGQHALGVNVYAAVLDEANFVTGPRAVKKHEIGMLALAEALVPHDEVLAMLMPLATRAFWRAKKCHRVVREARHEIRFSMIAFLNAHYYESFEREKLIEEISSTLLKGYQGWWRKVDKKRKKIDRARAKKGTSPYGSLEEALKKISPELYEVSGEKA